MTPKFQNKLIALQRYALWQQPMGKSNYYVSEFPKSGGTWFCQMLSGLTGVPFPRNRFISQSPSILHSHLVPHEKLNTPIVILRDGRDIMVSAYHHFIIPNDHCPSHEQKRWASYVDSSNLHNVKTNLAAFIEAFHQNYKIGGRSITWQEHVLACHPLDLLAITYEDLLSDPHNELLRVTKYIGLDVSSADIDQVIEQFSFTRMKEKDPQSKFLRKGTSGDWKNHFTYHSGELFESLAGEALRLLDYTTDNTWYHELPR